MNLDRATSIYLEYHKTNSGKKIRLSHAVSGTQHKQLATELANYLILQNFWT